MAPAYLMLRMRMATATAKGPMNPEFGTCLAKRRPLMRVFRGEIV